MKGEKAPIDPRYRERSLAEAKLVEVIDWCHEFDPQQRPSVFDVVQFLRDAKTEVEDALTTDMSPNGDHQKKNIISNLTSTR